MYSLIIDLNLSEAEATVWLSGVTPVITNTLLELVAGYNQKKYTSEQVIQLIVNLCEFPPEFAAHLVAPPE